MKIHAAEQGSSKWLELRAGIPTASEAGNLLTPHFKCRTGETPMSYLAFKVAEAWLGGSLPGFTSWATEQGHVREERAIDWYQLEHGDIQKVGFITTDDGSAGCSPDGLLGEDGGIEIKCPEPTQHVKYLIAGEVPDDYRVQVHFSMFVTGRPWWKFLSYRRGFPPLLLTVQRDPEIQDKIKEAMADYRESFDFFMQKLVEANGGTRPKPKKYHEADWITKPLSELQPNP